MSIWKYRYDDANMSILYQLCLEKVYILSRKLAMIIKLTSIILDEMLLHFSKRVKINFES